MRTLKFYGASDDLFEIEGARGDEPDEICLCDRPVTVSLKLEPPPYDGGPEVGIVPEGLHVTGLYAPNDATACWMIGIAPLDEGLDMPGWPMRWRFDGYTTVLEIDAPDDVVVAGHTGGS